MRTWWLLVLCLRALPGFGEEVVAWSAAAEPQVARPGELITLALTGKTSSDWHIYAAKPIPNGPIATSFKLAKGSRLEPLGPLAEPTPEHHFDEGFGFEVQTHQGTVVLRQALRVPADAKPGAAEAAGSVTYQACNATNCMPPTDVPLKAAFKVEAGAVRPEHRDPPAAVAAPSTAVPKPPAAVRSEADEARAKGLGAFLVVAFLAGLAALLTPCVFPMVPITVSFFAKQAGDNARQRVSLALAYGAGIVGMYTGLGLLLAATLGASGANRVAANPFVNLGFAALFVFFGLSLFGLFELGLPSGLVNYVNRKGDAGGYLGAVFMGLTLTLAAFTCTVQFVGGVLVWAANGEWIWPILGMLSFSAAFALPFVLLALFPQYLSSLPKSGGWLENTKITLGFVELAAALKFLSNADLVWQWHLLSREMVLSLWALTAFGIAVFLWGGTRLGHDEGKPVIGRGRGYTGLVFLCLSGYLLWGLNAVRLNGTLEALMPPPEYNRAVQPEVRAAVPDQTLEWLDDLDAGLKQAQQDNRNVFIDFSGVTCTNCRWMEQSVFPQPEVAQRLHRFTLVRVYVDSGPRAADWRELQVKQFGNSSQPFYAILKPDGTPVATFPGLTSTRGWRAERASWMPALRRITDAQDADRIG
ncbi:MAG: thioredoxin family protein [Armatimonadetes bacterium]|nr:thioredoxin family protein [Armatimonadota bacterium]